MTLLGAGLLALGVHEQAVRHRERTTAEAVVLRPAGPRLIGQPATLLVEVSLPGGRTERAGVQVTDDHFVAGQQVQVFYDPESPTDVRLAGRDAGRAEPAGKRLFVAAAVAGLLAVVLWTAAVDPRLRRLLAVPER